MRLARRGLLVGMGALGGTGLMTIRRSRAQSTPIRLGLVAPLSGPAAPLGLANRLGAEAVRNYLNRNGGINGRQIEFVEFDDAANPNKAVSAVRELASKGINLIVGPSLTATTMAVAPLMPGLQCMCVFMSAGEVRLTRELFNRNIFVTAQSIYTRYHEIAEFMAKRYPDVSVWTGAMPDNAVGYDGWAAFKRAFTDIYPKIAKREVSFIDPVASKYGATDYKVQISQLMTTPATGFWTTLFGNDGITFYQQAMQFGLSKKFKAMVDYGMDVDLPKTLKRNVPTNMWCSSLWFYGATPSHALTKEVLGAFTASGDPYPNGHASAGGTPVLAYAAAIKAAGSTDTDKVIAALENLKFESIGGPAHYRKEDHQMVGRSFMVRYAPTEAEPGWKSAEFAAIEDANVINPPAPGVKWVD